MKSRSSYAYVLIGLLLRLLANVTSSATKEFVVGEIGKLKESLINAGYNVSRSNFVSNSFADIEQELLKLDDDDEIGDKVQDLLEKEMSILERIVFSEGITKKVYVIPERRFNSNFLMNEQEKLFKSGIFKKLPELAIFDIKSSCRCILFGEGTAAAFHILRATEGVLKSYYCHHIKRDRLEKAMWGPMLIKLRGTKKNKPPKELLDNLDSIRVSYRNPTQHPEEKYDIDDAQDLFGRCSEVIGKMASEL